LGTLNTSSYNRRETLELPLLVKGGFIFFSFPFCDLFVPGGVRVPHLHAIPYPSFRCSGTVLVWTTPFDTTFFLSSLLITLEYLYDKQKVTIISLRATWPKRCFDKKWRLTAPLTQALIGYR